MSAPGADIIRKLRSAGGHPFACDPKTKAPLVLKGESWEDPEHAAASIERHPDAPIGMRPADVQAAVLDVDVGEHCYDDLDGIQDLVEAAAFSYETPSGGLHLWYRHDPSEVIKQRMWRHKSDKPTRERWRRGEIRHADGYVVVWDPAVFASAPNGAQPWPAESIVTGVKKPRKPKPKKAKPKKKPKSKPQPVRDHAVLEDDVRDALDVLDPDCDYETWLEIGMALDSEGLGHLWTEWSSKGAKFEAGVCEEKLASFQGSGTTIGTLFKLAQDEGWVRPVPPSMLDEPETDDEPQRRYVRRRDLYNQQERFQCDPGALAHRILDRMADRIAVVIKDDDEGSTTALILRPRGSWSRSPDAWFVVIYRELQSMLSDVARELVKGRCSLAEAKRRSNRIHTQLRNIHPVIEKVRASIAGTYRVVPGVPKPHVVLERLLDADMQVMGFENGVVDLTTAKLLDPEEAAGRFVTRSTGIRFDRDKAEGVDEALFGHLAPDVRTFWRDVLAWILRGRPSRRIWLVVGAPNSGKTTVANALLAAFGPQYASVLMQDALQKQRGDSAHKGISVFGSPHRIVVVEEPSTGNLDTELLKAISGGGNIKVRRLYKEPQDIRATGSLIIFANPGASVPRLGLADEALADRLRELPYDQVPSEDRDIDFMQHVESLEFRESLAAHLVVRCASMQGPPSSPGTVRAASQARLELDLSPLEEFARHIVRGEPEDFLSSTAVFTHWMAFHDVEKAPESGRVAKHSTVTLVRALRKKVDGLPVPSKAPRHMNRVRGWPGWRYDDSA